MRKSVAFLYTNNKQTEKEIRKTIPFTIASKIVKYLGINIMKETKGLFSKNYETSEERNRRRHQKMERPSMLVDQ
jgi:isocitrate dehydrogenase